MDRSLEKYLEIVDTHLKPLPTSERVDIVREIKSSMLEMEKTEGLTPGEIIKRLGDPRDMARAYLGDMIYKNTSFSWNKLLTIMAFYSLAGFSGVVVIPTLALVAPVFMLCGVVVPICGLIEVIGFIFNFDLPFAILNFGPYTVHPVPAFIITVIVGGLLYQGGRCCWKLLIKYIHKVSQTKKDLSI